jgi:DNA processing protein
MGVLVIEAGERSGSLITARLSGELGKEVFALPGPVDRPEHIGSNRLLRDGATLITAIEDLIEELAPLATLSAVAGPQPLSPEAVKALTGRERAVYGLLGDESRSVDDLVRLGDIPVSAVQATLISLELKRLARRGPTGYTRAC